MEERVEETLPTDKTGNLTRDATIHYNHKLKNNLTILVV